MNECSVRNSSKPEAQLGDSRVIPQMAAVLQREKGRNAITTHHGQITNFREATSGDTLYFL